MDSNVQVTAFYCVVIHKCIYSCVSTLFPSMPSTSTVSPAGWKPDRCVLWTTGSGSFRSECHYYFFFFTDLTWFAQFRIFSWSERLYWQLSLFTDTDTSCITADVFLRHYKHLSLLLFPPACKQVILCPCLLFWYVVNTKINMNIVTQRSCITWVWGIRVL